MNLPDKCPHCGAAECLTVFGTKYTQPHFECGSQVIDGTLYPSSVCNERAAHNATKAELEHLRKWQELGKATWRFMNSREETDEVLEEIVDKMHELIQQEKETAQNAVGIAGRRRMHAGRKHATQRTERRQRE